MVRGLPRRAKKRKCKLDGAESDDVSQTRGTDERKDGEGPSDLCREKEKAAKKPRKTPWLIRVRLVHWRTALKPSFLRDFLTGCGSCYTYYHSSLFKNREEEDPP